MTRIIFRNEIFVTNSTAGEREGQGRPAPSISKGKRNRRGWCPISPSDFYSAASPWACDASARISGPRRPPATGTCSRLRAALGPMRSSVGLLPSQQQQGPFRSFQRCLADARCVYDWNRNIHRSKTTGTGYSAVRSKWIWILTGTVP